MGGGIGGGYSQPGGSLSANLKLLGEKYKSDSSGRLGVKDNGRVRVITSDNPLKTAQELFQKLSVGADIKSLGEKGWMATFADSSRVVFRPRSSDNSPAIDIDLQGTNSSRYKIHFQDSDYLPKGSK